MLRGNRFCLLLLLLFILFNRFYFGASLKCSKGGLCENLKWVDIKKNYNLTTECDVCIQFRCIVNGKHVIMGAGCPDEFQKYCNATADDMKKFNEKNDQFYWNHYLVFAKCTDRDHCADEYMNVFVREKVFAPIFGRGYNKALGENCDYKERSTTALTTIPTTSATAANGPYNENTDVPGSLLIDPGSVGNNHTADGNGSNSYQIHRFQISGALLIGLILANLW